MYPPTSQQREEKRRRDAAPPEPIPAAFWASVSERGAVDLKDILASRRHAEVWERHRRGEATDLELFSAAMDAYVPPDGRVAYLRKEEALYREIGDTRVLGIIAAWRLLQQS